MPTVLALVLLVIVGCVLYWGVMRILGAFGIGDPIATVVQVLLVILLLAAGLDALGIVNLGVAPRLR